MLWMLKLAVRFLDLRRGGPARFTAVLGVLGIAAAVAGVIVTSAVTRGFHSALTEKLLASTPHINVFRHDGNHIADGTDIRQKLSELKEVEEVSGSASVQTVIVGNENRAFAVLTSADSDERSGVRIGRELADRIGVKSGDWAEMLVFAEGDSPRKTRIFITEVIDSGIYDVDSVTVNASAAEFAAITASETFIPYELRLKLKDPMISETLAEGIREMLGKEFRVLGWQEANRPVLSALDLESKAAFLIFLFVGIIAAANIAAAILLLVAERRADIAVLRSCGMRTRNVAVIFLFQAMIVGSLGAFLGIILGFGICFVLNDLWTINVPGEIYLVSEFALLPMWTDIVFLLPAVILLSAVAGLYPALAAARIKPIEDLNNR
ncbi:MAG: ABC transporter permease [Acidobacteria bacterium]|nr:ABC transporter permease [Acidobacteriota bacterium]